MKKGETDSRHSGCAHDRDTTFKRWAEKELMKWSKTAQLDGVMTTRGKDKGGALTE